MSQFGDDSGGVDGQLAGAAFRDPNWLFNVGNFGTGPADSAPPMGGGGGDSATGGGSNEEPDFPPIELHEPTTRPVTTSRHRSLRSRATASWRPSS